MPQSQIDVGTFDPATQQGDFIYKQNQIFFARTTDATPTQVTIFDAGAASPYYTAGTLTLGVVITAGVLQTTATDSLTTLTSDVGAFDTSFVYTGSDPPFAPADVIRIDDEWMGVTVVDSGTNTLTVDRPVTPDVHLAAAVIYIVTAAGAVQTAACWGKTITGEIDIDRNFLYGQAVVRDLFPATKTAAARDLRGDLYVDSLSPDIIAVEVTGIAATTIDWTFNSTQSIYYHIT